jgi:hypothetical protein
MTSPQKLISIWQAPGKPSLLYKSAVSEKKNVMPGLPN